MTVRFVTFERDADDEAADDDDHEDDDADDRDHLAAVMASKVE